MDRAQTSRRAVNELEEGYSLSLDFQKLRKIAQSGQEVLPVVLQDADSGEVLFVGYANQEALQETLRTRSAVLWSTSRNELWRKGATSGDVLELIEIGVNCEQNSLLYRVRLRDGACHTKTLDGRTRRTCYYRRLKDSGDGLEPR
jgi:phosphoribosyl-AMP cyclohydrolase